jgi:tetratricopeptide (TPR) repeat protein
MCNGTMNVRSNESTECNTKVVEKDDLKVRQVVVRELEGLEFPALVLRVHDDEVDVVYIDDGQIEYDVPVEELNTSAEVKTSKVEIDEIWRKALDSLAAGYSSDDEESHVTKSDHGGKYIAADGTLIISHGDEKASTKATSEQLAGTCASPADKGSKKQSLSDSEADSEQLASTCASPGDEGNKKENCSDREDDSKDEKQSSSARADDGEDGHSRFADRQGGCIDEIKSEQVRNDFESPSDEEHDGVKQPQGPNYDFSSDSDDDQPERDPEREHVDRLQLAQFCGRDGIELRKAGEFDEAERQLRRSIDILEDELGEDHPYTLTSRNNLANLLMKMGNLPDAEIEYRRCLASKLEQLGNDHPVVATTHFNLGLVLSRGSNLEDSEIELKEALRIQVQELGEESPEAVKTSRSLCRILLKQGKPVDPEHL